jgi:hypothetical protein
LVSSQSWAKSQSYLGKYLPGNFSVQPFNDVSSLPHGPLELCRLFRNQAGTTATVEEFSNIFAIGDFNGIGALFELI